MDIKDVTVSILEANPYQPRMNMDEVALNELTESIKENDLSQPIAVTTDNVIIFGHRRVEAFKRLKRETIPAIVVDASAKDLQTAVIIENMQRENLTFLEKAKAFKDALERGIFSSQRQLAKALGKDPSDVQRTLSVLKLSPKIIDYLRTNLDAKKDSKVFYELNRLPSHQQQWEVFELYQTNELNREGAIKYIKSLMTSKKDILDKFNPLKFKGNTATISLKKIPSAKKKEFQEELSELVKKYSS